MIRITYVDPTTNKLKRVTCDGSTTRDAVAWMAKNVPGVYIFRAVVMRRRRPRPPMVAMDETGSGAHPSLRR